MNIIKNILAYLFPGRQGSSDGVTPVGFAQNEEFESKRTTKLGMVFVVIMVITGIWQGQILFKSINATITPPAQLSSCFSRLVSESGERIQINYDSSSYYSSYSYQNMLYDGYNEYNNNTVPSCTYTDIENRHGIQALYNSAEPLFNERSQKQKTKSSLLQELSDIQYSRASVRDSYNTSLLESMALSSSSVYSPSNLGTVLYTKEEQMQDLRSRISVLESEIALQTAEIKRVILAKLADLRAVADEFNTLLRWLELKRFLVSIILLAPLAFFTIRRYFRAKNERSEYAIIWSAVALISTILSAQLFVVFAYKILPHQFIEAVARMFAALFSQFAFLLVLLQWLALILVPLFFAFLVYIIQKKYYNKDAVMMRALKDGKCPRCSMKIKDQMVFCPSCSYELRKPCETCKHTSISYARFCEQCGTQFQKTTAQS